MSDPTKPKLFVTIDGEEIVASRPKFGLLKQATRLTEVVRDNPETFDTEEGIDLLFQLIVDIFNTDELTMENIEDVDLDSILSLQDINDWLEAYIPKKKVKEIKEVESMRSNQKDLKNT